MLHYQITTAHSMRKCYNHIPAPGSSCWKLGNWEIGKLHGASVRLSLSRRAHQMWSWSKDLPVDEGELGTVQVISLSKSHLNSIISLPLVVSLLPWSPLCFFTSRPPHLHLHFTFTLTTAVFLHGHQLVARYLTNHSHFFTLFSIAECALCFFFFCLTADNPRTK